MRGRNKEAFAVTNPGTRMDGISKANITFRITRDNNDIASGAALPFVLFAASSRAADYKQVLDPFLPAGISLDSLVVNSAGALEFTFTDGADPANTSVVTVSCNEQPYAEVLENSKQDLIVFERFKFQVPDVANVAQLDNGVEYAKRSIFGKGERTVFTPSDYTTPSDQNTNQVFVPNSLSVDKNSGLISTINLNTTEVIVGYSNRYIKYDASLLLP